MITLTKEQVEVVAHCIDAAIRAGGAQTARIAIPVLDDIARQMSEPIQRGDDETEPK